MDTEITALTPLPYLPDSHTARAIQVHRIRDELRTIENKEKPSTDEKQAALDLRIIEAMYLLSEFALVGLGDSADNESLRLYWQPNGCPYYSRLPRIFLQRVVMQAALTLKTPVSLTGSRVDRLVGTFMNRPAIIPNIERRVFYVSDDLFFNLDAKPGADQLVSGDKLPPTARCFFHLFDSSTTDKDIVSFPKETFDRSFSRKVMSAYDSLLMRLEEMAPNPADHFPAASLSATSQGDDPLPRHFSFIEDWANGNPGLYWDLMTIPATIFLKEKPTVSFFLSGSAMNGKSSYLGLIHSMLGTNNTTRVKLSDMDKWHLNTQLQYTLFNAPDDEGDSISAQSAEFFKSIASHGTISLPIMRSQVPMKLNADFMSAHPMNAFPDWGNTSSTSALTRRTCLIPFTADFRDRPRVENFAQKTFTPEVMAEFVGEVLALATFYSEHPLIWSDTTMGAKYQVEAENDSVRLYKEKWQQYFSGFQSIGLIHDDYRCWCRENGFEHVSDLNSFKIHFYHCLSSRSKTLLTGADGKPVKDKDGEPVRKSAYMDPNYTAINKKRAAKGRPKLIPMLDDTILPFGASAYGTIAEMHASDSFDKAIGKSSISAVTLMERIQYGA